MASVQSMVALGSLINELVYHDAQSRGNGPIQFGSF